MVQSKEELVEYKKRWYLKNRERLIKRSSERYYANHEENKRKNREYYYRNRDSIIAKNSERKLKIRKENRRIIGEIFGNKCSICGYSENPDILQYDHIIPLIDTGKTRKPAIDVVIKNPSSFQLLCPNCHATKTRKEMIDRGLWNVKVS